MDRAELGRRLGAGTAVAEAARVTVVEEREPAAFRARLAAAVAVGGPVFLADPGWGERERAQFNALVARADEGPADGRGWLMIPTGGSSGRIKLARHDEETLGAAVAGFSTFFGVREVEACGVLPLHHVSGLMAWLRCVLTGGRYVDGDWPEIAAGRRPAGTGGFVSLVPTQLARLIGDGEAEAWLRGFRAVLVGGAAAWPELVERAAAAGLPVAFSYGMTETAAMVTGLRPEEFAQGRRGCGGALPHARVEVGDDGEVVIASASLFRGYWPERRAAGAWSPGDVAAWDERGSLRIAGRRDALIVSGGEKVNPAEVEAALRAAGAPDEIVVIGVPDARWGEAVTACFPRGAAGDPGAWAAGLEGRLARFKWPKRYVPVEPWPRTAAGKVDRGRLRAAAVDPGGEVGG